MALSVKPNVFLSGDMIHRGWNVQVTPDRAVAFRDRDSIDLKGDRTLEPHVTFLAYGDPPEQNPHPLPGKPVGTERLEVIDPKRGHLMVNAHTYRLADVQTETSAVCAHYGFAKSTLQKAVRKVEGHDLFHAHKWDVQFEIEKGTPYATSPKRWKRGLGQTRQRIREMRSGIAAAFIRPREAGESGGRLIQMSTPLNALLITSSSLVGLILIMHLAKQQKAGTPKDP